MSEVDRIINLLDGDAERLARGLVLDIHGRLTETTPVDTGWARSNWLPSVATPITEPIGSKEQVNTGAAQGGLSSILGWRFIQGPAYIANNVPYITDLNNGTSPQAPAGFVEIAIQAGINSLGR